MKKLNNLPGKMGLQDIFYSATQSLLAHPLRSGLTTLGIVIGNTAFLVMASLGESAKYYTMQQLESFYGPNRLVAYATSGADKQRRSHGGQLTLSDAAALTTGVPAIQAVAPVVGQMIPSQAGRINLDLWVTGTTADYLKVKNENVATGRFFSQSELDQKARVVVLGSELPARLFPYGRPLGQSLVIGQASFRVVGVMKAKGTLGKFSPDEFVYIPMSTFSAYLRGADASGNVLVDYIEISARGKERVDDAIFQAQNVLHARRGARDFGVSQNLPYQELISGVSSALTAFLAILAVVSLLIGGIGIMNVMLVTVSERTGEIGLRKAIGAHNQTILLQFLVEASLLSMLGGAVGLLIGFIVVVVVVVVSPLPFVMPVWSVVTAFTLSTMVGVISGVSPAMHAARLDPIAALRSA